MKEFLKESKNRIMIFLIIIIMLMVVSQVFVRSENDELKEKINAKCWITLLDDNGIGFASRVLLDCKALRNNCITDNHNISCYWEELNEKKGCRCEV